MVTYAEAFNVQPFSNALMTFPMTGTQIPACSGSSASRAVSAGRSCTSVCHQGLTYTLAKTFALVDHDNNPVTPSSTPARSISVTNVQLNGDPLDPAATYTVTANQLPGRRR